ncbi:IclR family transcriptional regulator C-terminal domain-containing protein [Asticcacaulis benevestitus]|nr:IclR family transcriptional regulator C-terminal domain-containing protein [Asticcacaulis benevestitus]
MEQSRFEKATDKSLPADCVGSVVHAFTVLHAFDLDHREMTLSEVAERIDMTRAGARRYLLTLIFLGYVAQDGRLFRLTPKVLDLGFSYLSTLSVVDIAQPYLNRIARDTHETTAIAVLDNREVVHLARARVQRELAPVVTIGRRFSALYNSTGRVLIASMSDTAMVSFVEDADLAGPTPHSITSKAALLAALQAIRKQGFAIVDQESELGLRSIAVPIFDRRGNAVAALNVITSVASVPVEDLQGRILPILRTAADEISSALIVDG